ncbi:MAG: 16S rRNA (uracil(1498)-N(3))-methyltransferase [Burkholderiaceae bacterium]
MAIVPRIHVTTLLSPGLQFALPPGAARHVQVLRLQPGAPITLFGGAGDSGEYAAAIVSMGRRDVQVLILRHTCVERKAHRTVHLALGVPANERMDWLVEKATELGTASVQPLVTERTVVRLDSERAQKRVAHWRSIAIAACEQCGRNRVPEIHAPETLGSWARLHTPAVESHARLVLSLLPQAVDLRELLHGGGLPEAQVTVLLGPEGGLAGAEEARVLASGFVPVSLGAQVLRAETAAMAALTLLG